MEIVDCIQGTEEWYKARLGKITASRVHDILPGKYGYKVARKKYKAQLISEILTGNVQESFCSQAMQYGKDMESIARSAYEAQTGNFVEEVGFIICDTLDYLGCSPDGLGEDRGLEIKCPDTSTHIDTIERFVDGKHKIPSQYYTQIQTAMMCTQFDEWDYVSFDNRLTGRLQIYIESVNLDYVYCQKIYDEVKKFWKELQMTLDKLRRYQEIK
jgi:putative phage-type endonuclease